MKKIVSIVLVSIIGISIIPKTLVNEKHIVLESTTSVYTKEEVDSLLSIIRNNITTNTNEITNIKSELTTLKNSLSNYALKTSLNTTNSNIDNLNTIASNNSSKITTLETLYSGGNATASDILNGKTAIVGNKKITGAMANRGTLNWKPTESTTYTVPAGYYSGGTLDSSSVYQAGYDAGLTEIPEGSRYGVARITGSGAGKSATATVPEGSTIVARGVESSSSGFGCTSFSTSASISGTTLTVSVGGSNLTGGFQNWTMVVVYKY